MLKIEHLTKTYGGKPAVQDLCLHIRPGELCAFIGHNGAGKTTTLKCCCGIQQFDAGEIYVDGISVREDPLASHQLKTQMKAFCAQGGAIFFSTHVLEVAEKLCDRVAILRKGQLVREGAMEEVRGDDTLEEVFLELEDTGEAL